MPENTYHPLPIDTTNLGTNSYRDHIEKAYARLSTEMLQQIIDDNRKKSLLSRIFASSAEKIEISVTKKILKERAEKQH